MLCTLRGELHCSWKITAQFNHLCEIGESCMANIYNLENRFILPGGINDAYHPFIEGGAEVYPIAQWG